MTEQHLDKQKDDFPRGFRMTPQRIAILEEVRNAAGHLTAADITEKVRQKHPSISVGTVYRTLNSFAERGVILEFPFGNQASRFDARTERHDHVHCTVCGKLHDVDVPSALLAHQVASEQSGFNIQGHQTIFSGICPICQAKQERTED
ncbi:MAG: transcriptional repressor [Thermomicrobiales bacterium]